ATTSLAQVKQEQPRSALGGHNTNAPVDVTSDRIEVQTRAHRPVFSGNVHVIQADLTLDTDRLTVAYSGGQGSSGLQINRLDAAGARGAPAPAAHRASGSLGHH